MLHDRFGDLISQAMGDTASVLRARYQSRMGGAGGLQDISLGSVDQPNDIQARAGSYIRGNGGNESGMGTGMMIAAAAVVALILVVALRK